MPLYEYKCAECSKVFTERKSFDEYRDDAFCECGGKGEKLIQPMTIHWGLGFTPAGGFHRPDGSAKKAAKMWDNA